MPELDALKAELFGLVGLALGKAHRAGVVGGNQGTGMYGLVLAETHAAVERFVAKLAADLAPKPAPQPPQPKPAAAPPATPAVNGRPHPQPEARR